MASHRWTWSRARRRWRPWASVTRSRAHTSTGIVGAPPLCRRFMTQAPAPEPDRGNPGPAGVNQIGQNYFLPGTQSLPATLAGRWPVCRFRSFNPYTVTDAQLTVNGLPCVLGYTPRNLDQGG